MHYKEVKAILSPQNGMNVYRGCTYGCIYCDSRSKCHRITHEFEDIEVKDHADEMLEKTLRRKRTKGMITTGALTDPYVFCEEELRLFRRCLNQIERFDFGVVIQTKSNLILRDLDILEKINRKTKCVVCVSFSTSDEELCRILEPGAPTARERFEVLMELKKCGIPTIVSISPILPYITDTKENLKGILDYCINAQVYGIINTGMSIMLREGCKEYFFDKIEKLYPGMAAKYIALLDGGNEAVSPNSAELTQYLSSVCEEHGICYDREELTRYMREYKNKTLGEQLSLFDFEV